MYSEILQIDHQLNTSFFLPGDSLPDFEGMLQSLTTIDDIHIMTFHGNFDALLAFHQKQIMNYFENQAKSDRDSMHCSLFSYMDKTGAVYYGRNFDNRKTGLLVGLFIPDSGYMSLGFVPLIEFKFDDNNPFDPMSQEHRRILLHSPAVTVDGINEKGLVVSVASVAKQKVIADSSKPYLFLLHLKRRILDHAFDVNSAIKIASASNIFDNGLHRISHHILIADSSGKSAILEWHNGDMQVIENTQQWQIVTNTAMYQVSDAELSLRCSRFSRIYTYLQAAADTMSWKQCMGILSSVKQRNNKYYLENGPLTVSTQWSAVFDIKQKAVYVCSGMQYEKVYHFKIPDRNDHKFF